MIDTCANVRDEYRRWGEYSLSDIELGYIYDEQTPRDLVRLIESLESDLDSFSNGVPGERNQYLGSALGTASEIEKLCAQYGNPIRMSDPAGF